jgi:hypothetical protein
VAGLGLCAAGWLMLTPFAFGYQDRGWHDAALTDLATGGGLAGTCLVTVAVWAVAWRRALRADGVLTGPSHRKARRQARAQRRPEPDVGGATDADPAQILSALRALLLPLLDPPAERPRAEGSKLPPLEASEPPPAEAAEPFPAEAAEPAIPGPRSAPGDSWAMPVGPGGTTAIQSVLAGAEPLAMGYEEEAW